MKSDTPVWDLKTHLADATGFSIVATPVGALMENVFVGMSDDVSFSSRLFVVGLNYAGFGRLLGYGMDRSREFFGVTSTTRELVRQTHDMAYIGVCSLVANPIIYWTAGERDTGNIVAGTLAAALVGALSGGMMGYGVDVVRDLTGLRKSDRVPLFVSRARPVVKGGLAALLVAGSLGVTGLIYALTPNEEVPQSPALEEVIRQKEYSPRAPVF